MKKIIGLTLLAAISFKGFAQEKNVSHKGVEDTPTSTDQPVQPPTSEEDKIYTSVDQIPEFPGGGSGINKYLMANVVYPSSAKANNIQGRVLVQFVVDKKGLVKDVKIWKGKSPTLGSGLEEEAIRVVESMPQWTPGRQNGKPVSVKYILPISFKLPNK